MAKFEGFIVILLMCLMMTGQQTNAQEEQQQQVPAKIAEDNANNKSPTIQQQQQPQLAKVALEKQAIEAPQPKPAMEAAYEVPAVAGKIVDDGKDDDKDKVVVISEKTLSEHQAAVAAAAAEGAAHPPQVVAQQQDQKPPAATKPESKPKDTSAEASDSKSTNDNNNNSDDTNKLPHEDDDESMESSQNANIVKIKNKPLGLYPDMDIDDDSYKTASLFFLGISSFAVLFIAYKIYRMRLTRAERKYGVQGNRAAQELTPLPMSVDDAHGNSDDEDHTLFDRHQVRIL